MITLLPNGFCTFIYTTTKADNYGHHEVLLITLGVLPQLQSTYTDPISQTTEFQLSPVVGIQTI